ncbi:MAG: alpha/beta hydrolase [Verrucomicrobiae bacterium]|nr:alpha/beta hydrolase [Verrucomicrobiae bacterium]
MPTVIIHGWSDHAVTFVPLQQELNKRLGIPVPMISLAEWLSLNDLVTYDDLVTRMDAVWTAYGLPRTPGAVDVITHSTGALLIRDWMTRYFAPGAAPVKHLVMLAPANFGSPLAHKGASFIGRIIKGWNAPSAFQVGAKLLKGLELASPYTWALANKDLFVNDPYFGPGRVLATVLVGNAGYTGIASAANEPGSDGTVRVSTANLNAAQMQVDLTDPAAPQFRGPQNINGIAGFLILDGLNHETIHDPTQAAMMAALAEGLQVDDAGFSAYCARLDAATQAVMAAREAGSDRYYWGYQNTVVLVKDQFGNHVGDYFLEFYGAANDTFWESLFHGKVIEDVHPYSDDNGYRSVLIDTTRLQAALAGAPAAAPLQFSLSASPDISNNEVGYASFTDNDIGAISIPTGQIPLFFSPNRTLFVEVIITRKQKDEIFKLGVAPPAPIGS